MALSITLRQIKEATLTNLGLIVFVVADTVDTTNHTVKVSDVPNKTPDSYLVRDAFFVGREANDTGMAFRRIVNYADPETPDTLQLQGGPDGISNGDDCAIYLGLNPEEVRSCVNDALSEMWKAIKIPFDFVTNQTDYACDDMDDPEVLGGFCDWIQVRGQIEAVRVKTEFQTGLIQEQEWAGVRVVENNNSVELQFTYLPYPYNENSSQVTGVITANKPYSYPGSELTDDDDTTTCPMGLAQIGVGVKVVRLLYKKYGTESMRARFGATLALLEQEWEKRKSMYMPAMRASGINIEETYYADIPWIMVSPPW